MSVGWLRSRQPPRIGHRGKVAVIGVADPARARKIGAIFAGAAAAQHRLAGRGDDVGIEAFALGRKTLPGRIPDRFARARKIRGRRRRPDGHRRTSCDRRRDRGTACPTGTAPVPSVAAGIRSAHNWRRWRAAAAAALNEGWMSKPARPARGRVRRPRPASGWHRRQRPRARDRRRPEASALRAIWRKPCGRSRVIAARESSTEPITPERRNSVRSVALSTITSATSPEKLMSLAPIDSSTRSSLRSGCRRFAAVTASRNSASCALTVPAAVGARFGRRAFARALRAEQAVGDGGAGAGERQIGHRDVRILHGKRQRGAGLVAVQRAVAGRIQPQRALALPHLQRSGASQARPPL